MNTKLNIIILLTLSVVLGSKKKAKSGVDIHIKDSYHPWDAHGEDHIQSKRPTSSQHLIAEFLLENIHPGDSLDKCIEKFEEFSSRNHMGMTLGNEKGRIIESSLRQNLFRNDNEHIIIVEFGSHIGDGTLRIIREVAKSGSNKKCTVLSYESNQEWLGIGTSLVRHALNAASETKCKYIPMLLTDDVSHIAEHLKSQFGESSISGIFLDHNHAKFYRDINILRERKLMRKGTLVMADNALRHRGVMRSFIQSMKDHSSKFELLPVNDPYPDQVLVCEWNEATKTRATDEL